MLEKKDFIRSMETIKESREALDKYLADNPAIDHEYTWDIIFKPLYAAVETLSMAMEQPLDTQYGNDIDYFIWDRNFGEDPLKPDEVTKDGVNLGEYYNSIEGMYDLLTM